MAISERDKVVLVKILGKIEILESIVDGISMDEFMGDDVKMMAVAMGFLTIGELSSKYLTDEFIQSEPSLPYREMRAMRNIAAHEYDAHLGSTRFGRQ